MSSHARMRRAWPPWAPSTQRVERPSTRLRCHRVRSPFRCSRYPLGAQPTSSRRLRPRSRHFLRRAEGRLPLQRRSGHQGVETQCARRSPGRPLQQEPRCLRVAVAARLPGDDQAPCSLELPAPSTATARPCLRRRSLHTSVLATISKWWAMSSQVAAWRCACAAPTWRACSRAARCCSTA